jgi:hypothetical protein
MCFASAGGEAGSWASKVSKISTTCLTMIKLTFRCGKPKQKPHDRQIIISYLEGMEASSIGDITGLSPENIAMKVHRIKDILRRWSGEGGLNAQWVSNERSKKYLAKPAYGAIQNVNGRNTS